MSGVIAIYLRGFFGQMVSTTPGNIHQPTFWRVVLHPHLGFPLTRVKLQSSLSQKDHSNVSRKTDRELIIQPDFLLSVLDCMTVEQLLMGLDSTGL